MAKTKTPITAATPAPAKPAEKPAKGGKKSGK